MTPDGRWPRRWSALRQFPTIPQLAPFEAILRGGGELEGLNALFKDEMDVGAPDAAPARRETTGRGRENRPA